MRKLPPLMLALLSLPAAAQDPRLSFLEQEVRNLNQQVRSLTQQVNALRNQPGRVAPAAAGPAVSAPASETPQWVSAARWRQLRTGMSELEVIGALGPPTSMREQDDARILFYALEIGPAQFLGGSVKLRDRAVVEVRQPTLQ
jgi:hypothetical protein